MEAITEKELQKINRKVEAEMRKISDVIDPITSRLYDKLDKIERKKTGASEEVPTCGTCKSVKNMTSRSVKTATQVQNEIVEQIQANPHVFNDVAGAIFDSTAISSGGGESGQFRRIYLPEIGVPKWVKELNGLVKGMIGGKKKRGKEYYDPEDLVRGVLSKQPEKVVKKEQFVFTVLDTSGSMGQSTETGISFLQLMMNQIPPIVREFQGEVIMCDGNIQRPIYTNLQIRDALDKSKGIVQKGGGGTDFDEAYQHIIDTMKEKRKSNPNAQSITITLTDAGVTWNKKLIEEIGNFIVVTTPKERRNVMSIIQMFPPEKYPNIRTIFIR